MIWKNLGQSASRNEFCVTTENSCFKAYKTGTVPGKPRLMEYLHMSEQNRDVISDLYKLCLDLVKILGAVHF